MREEVRDSIRTTDGGSFETDVSTEINEILADYNDRDIEAIQDHLNEIKKIIGEEIEGSIDLKFGGSVSKNTYVDGLSDIDTLLFIDKTELTDSAPKDVLEYIASQLNGTLNGYTNIECGKLAVTIDFDDGNKIQILPAMKKGEGFKIPSIDGTKWSKVVRPDKFASKLTEVNKSINNNVVPAIKLAKGIISQFPEDQQLKGYHIESIAIKAFQRYPNSEKTTKKALLTHFFEKAKEIVKKPITDSSNQSFHVDGYLGNENSKKRRAASNMLNKVFEKMERANVSCSAAAWSEILGR
ncbi:CBASS oligonucleotide cyclase [Methanobacterium formicicum]|uniref:protein adenylyltransferase n=1 Tax=Methanobacterium formicicum (strain DSM 3637 / PP1) TaxID=1204725 RepID=K2R3W5_METFP|nr:CBASS oligonucleotide cyclase [Methanobacterium formicicum]EKF85857.1 hypothetical protein A994_07245 [Methanobacterium formicicum DSM 3637]